MRNHILKHFNDMKLLFVYISIIMLIQACDPDLSISFSEQATAPRVNAAESLDGFAASFTPELEIVNDDYESILWSKQSGPGQVFFDDPTSPAPTIYGIHQVTTSSLLSCQQKRVKDKS